MATWDEPFGWWPRLERELLEPLAAGRPGALRVNDWSGGLPVPGRTLAVPVPEVLILEGVSAARRQVRERASVVLWVHLPDGAGRLERAVARDGEAAREHLMRWQQGEDRHFRADRTAAAADLWIDETQPSSGHVKIALRSGRR